MRWTSEETFKSRCDRLLRDVIIGEYRPPTPYDPWDDELVAADAVLVWLDSVGIGSDSPQHEHIRRYLSDIEHLHRKVDEQRRSDMDLMPMPITPPPRPPDAV